MMSEDTKDDNTCGDCGGTVDEYGMCGACESKGECLDCGTSSNDLIGDYCPSCYNDRNT